MTDRHITERAASAQAHTPSPREIKNAILVVLREDDNLPDDPGRPFIPTRVLGLIDDAFARAQSGEFK